MISQRLLSVVSYRSRHTADENDIMEVRVPCTVCDSGVLIPKELPRLSRPAVVIGYILLIPSVLGMLVCAIIFFTVMGGHGDTFQEGFDGGFRQFCANSFVQSYRQAAGQSPSLLLTAQYCECALTVVKENNSANVASQICIQKVKDNALGVPEQKVQNLYTDAFVTKQFNILTNRSII
jgi:hypothetical protein